MQILLAEAQSNINSALRLLLGQVGKNCSELDYLDNPALDNIDVYGGSGFGKILGVIR